MKSSVVSAVSLLATAVVGIHFPTLRVPLPPQDDDTFAQLYLPATANSTSAHNLTGTAFFDQLLDHDDPSKGTFQQQYWWNATNWAGPGSPVCRQRLTLIKRQEANSLRSSTSHLEKSQQLLTSAT